MRALIAAHVHSTWSYDGTLSLDQVASGFRHLAFDAVLMSEHSRGFDQDRWEAYRSACRDASKGILLVPGIEYEDASNRVHILVWGPVPFFAGVATVGDILRAAHSHRASAVLAHPRRQAALDALTPGDLDLLTGIETWNRRYDGWCPVPGIRRLLDERPGLMEVAGLDLHRRLDFFPLALRAEIPARLDNDAVYAALYGRSCVAQAFGVSVAPFFHGLPHLGLSVLDRIRKRLASAAGIGS